MRAGRCSLEAQAAPSASSISGKIFYQVLKDIDRFWAAANNILSAIECRERFFKIFRRKIEPLKICSNRSYCRYTMISMRRIETITCIFITYMPPIRMNGRTKRLIYIVIKVKTVCFFRHLSGCNPAPVT